MNSISYLRVFLVIYFYTSLIIASIDGFNNMLSGFKLSKIQVVIYILFPLTLIIEVFMFILYTAHKKLSKKK